MGSLVNVVDVKESQTEDAPSPSLDGSDINLLSLPQSPVQQELSEVDLRREENLSQPAAYRSWPSISRTALDFGRQAMRAQNRSAVVDQMVTVEEPCPMCGERWDGDSFMLRCDMCFRWVHKTCLRADEEELSSAERFWCWHCDIPPSARSGPITLGHDELQQSSRSREPSEFFQHGEGSRKRRLGDEGGRPQQHSRREPEDGGKQAKLTLAKTRVKGRGEQQTPLLPEKGERVIFKWNEHEWYEGTLSQHTKHTSKERMDGGMTKRKKATGRMSTTQPRKPEWWTVVWDHGGRSRIRLDESTRGRWHVLCPGDAQRLRIEGIPVVHSGDPVSLPPGTEYVVRYRRAAGGSASSSQDNSQASAEASKQCSSSAPTSGGFHRAKERKGTKAKAAAVDRSMSGAEKRQEEEDLPEVEAHDSRAMAESKSAASAAMTGGDFKVKVRCFGNGANKDCCLEGVLMRTARGQGVPVVLHAGQELSLTAFEDKCGSSARRPRQSIQLVATGQPIGHFLDLLGV